MWEITYLPHFVFGGHAEPWSLLFPWEFLIHFTDKCRTELARGFSDTKDLFLNGWVFQCGNHSPHCYFLLCYSLHMIFSCVSWNVWLLGVERHLPSSRKDKRTLQLHDGTRLHFGKDISAHTVDHVCQGDKDLHNWGISVKQKTLLSIQAYDPQIHRHSIIQKPKIYNLSSFIT